MASISSLTCMVPIWAVKALPERPATMIAVISTPISRRTEMPSRLTVKISAPKRAQLVGALIGQHDADQEGEQADDRQGVDAGLLDLGDRAR